MAAKPRGAQGGRRAGAGRKKGARTVKASARVVKKLATDGGDVPLDVQVYAMRFHFERHKYWHAQSVHTGLKKAEKLAADKISVAELKDARDAARDAAPYMHPRLNAVDHSGSLRLSFEDALQSLEEDEADGAAGA